MRHSICAPVGGFANHYRWLILLSQKYNSLGLLNANSFMGFKRAFPWNSKDKVKFIEENVYSKERTHSNWIAYEWRYRGQLDHIITISHKMEVATKNIVGPHKILASVLDPIDCLKHYVRFNPTLNTFTPKDFIKRCEDENKGITDFVCNPNEELLIVEGKTLYTPKLDKSLYYKIINFFELEDLYDYANEIHQMWYGLHNA
jgi:hypothetical protein